MTAGRLARYLRPYRRRIAWAVAAMVVVALFNGFSVLLLKPIVDQVFIAKDFRMLWAAVLIVPLVVAAKSAASYAQNYLMSWLGQQVTQELRQDLFRRLHSLPLDYFSRHEGGEILSRVTGDLIVVQAALTSLPLYVIRDSMTVLALLVALFYLDWRFALLSLVSLPLTSGALVVLSRKQRATSLQSQAVLERIYQRFQESIRGMSLIRSFNYEEAALAKFDDENRLFLKPMMSYLRATALAAPLLEFCGGIVAALILYFGGCEVILGHMTPGAFFAFLGAFFAAYAPIKNVARSNSELQRAIASGQRILQLLDEHPASELQAPGSVTVFSGLGSEIRFERVFFRYPGRAENALTDCSFSIPRAGRTAIVGPSGCGKTTITQLLLRLYEPTSGSVLFDGIDARSIDPRSLRAQIGLVSQDTMLFHDSILENVALSRDVVTLAEVERACRAAGAADFIARLPQGYQTKLGDPTLSLSAGQRQKLGIARVVLKNPSMIVLDEATANLDPVSEAEVMEALRRLFGGRTVVMIAHKLASLTSFDHIIVMSHGRVVEQGTHEELLAKDGFYKRQAAAVD